MRDFLTDLVHRTFESGQEIEPRLASRFEPPGAGSEHPAPFELALNAPPSEPRTIAPGDTAAAAPSARAVRTVETAGDGYAHREPVAMRRDGTEGLPARAPATDGSPREASHVRDITSAAKAGALIAEGETGPAFARAATTAERPADSSDPQVPDGPAGSSRLASGTGDSVTQQGARSALSALAEHPAALTPRFTSPVGALDAPAMPAPPKPAAEGVRGEAGAAPTTPPAPRLEPRGDRARPTDVPLTESSSQLITPRRDVWNASIAPLLPVTPDPAAVTPSPGPTINVTIGRIEIRATPLPTTAKKTPSGGPVLTLNDYLRQRAGEGGR